MPLLDLHKDSPEQLLDKRVYQIIAFAGDGRLKDDSAASAEFREYLAEIPSEQLEGYVGECLTEKFEDNGLALQDLVNELGARVGFTVEPGRYRGTTKHIGHDGLWTAPEGQAIVVEVKTTDAYRIDLDKIAEYRRKLIDAESIDADNSSMLIIVGRQDTGDLEAQVRGSKHAWDVRLMSVDALSRLLKVKEEIEDPETAKRIRTLLVPHDYTRIDEIIELVFSTTADLLDEDAPEVDESGGTKKKRKKKFTPVSFHEECVERIKAEFSLNLIRRSRATFASPDGNVVVVCAVSREHKKVVGSKYWFAFHPHQMEQLEAAEIAYVGFGCGSADKVLVLGFDDFATMLPDFNETVATDGRRYWHVHIVERGKSFMIRLKGGVEPREVTQHLLASP